MADNKVNSGLLEFSEDQKVFVALDAETSEVKKAVTIDGDGVETDIQGVQPSGKKEITSTAEVNVANYATAQVVDEDLVAGNIKKDVDILGVVGSYEPEAPASDFSTAEVTVQAITGNFGYYIPNVIEMPEPLNISFAACEPSIANVKTVILYKGMAKGNITQGSELNIETTGDIEISGNTITITGNGTIIVTNEVN